MYECPNCGDNLKFEIESQLLKVCCLWFNENKSKGQEAPFPRSGQAAWKEKWKNDSEIEDIISTNQKLLGTSGRILVRESGTEPLVRVMVEGKRFDLINDIAVKIADKIKECCPAD